MSSLYIAADHRGFELKQTILAHMHAQSVPIVDCGNKIYEPADDYVDVVSELAKHMVHDSLGLGVVICGSGCGVAISANRFAHLRATTAIDPPQLEADCRDDLVNVLALGADYISAERAIEAIELFMQAPRGEAERYHRRVNKLTQLGTTIA